MAKLIKYNCSIQQFKNINNSVKYHFANFLSLFNN